MVNFSLSVLLDPPLDGLSGNEKADVLTKRAIQLPPANHNALLLQDYVPSIGRSIRVSWQSRWDQCESDGNKLAQLKLSLGSRPSCFQRCRRLEVSLSRLRIGHTRLTHGHLIAREPPTLICGRCQVRLSVLHVLVKFPAYSVPRNRIFPSLTSVPLRERLSLLLSESTTFSSSILFAFLSVSGLMSDL